MYLGRYVKVPILRAKKMQERIDRQEGREITKYAESLGLGTTEYELINIE